MTQTLFAFAVEYRHHLTGDTVELRIAKGQLSLLVALLSADDSRGTLDDATADLSATFEDGGKWRGQIPLQLVREGLIAEVGAVNSRRTRRNRGLLRRWRLVDADKARRKVEALRRWIEAQKIPQTAATDAGSESSDRRQSVANSAPSLPNAKEPGQ